MSRAEIISRLEDPGLPDRIVAELNRCAEAEETAPVGEKSTAAPGEFASKVHGWNRQVLWRRSSKE
jgi:hypothetical protein